MNRITTIAAALGVFFAASSIIPVSAMPTTSQPVQAVKQVEQAKVVIKRGNWRGHRGFRNARPGYRRHVDGFWYPRAAFTVRVAPAVRIKFGQRHARWCRDRYTSYRVSDNTFVVRGGMRRACRSPY